jgi:hypothetical protein
MIYLQMPKTATSHTVMVLKHNFPGCGIEHGHEPLTTLPANDEVVFGSIRDPLDWYLSAWSGQLVPCLAHLYRDNGDPRYFRTWMKELEAPEIRNRIGNGFQQSSHGLYSHEAERLYARKGKWFVEKFIRIEEYENTLTAIIGPYEDPFGFKFNESLRKFSNNYYYDDETRARVRTNDCVAATQFGYLNYV